MPCARSWRPDGANLRAWWPAYLGGFLLIVSGIPRAELMLSGYVPGEVALATTPLAAAIVIRFMSRRAQPEPAADSDEPDAIQVLDL